VELRKPRTDRAAMLKDSSDIKVHYTIFNASLNAVEALTIITALLLLLISSAIFLTGTHLAYYVGDQLDNTWPDIQAMLREHKIFAANSTLVEGIANGIPREFLAPETKFLVTFAWLIGDPITTYVVVNVANVVFGFCSFFLFATAFAAYMRVHSTYKSALFEVLKVRCDLIAIIVISCVYASRAPYAIYNLTAVSLPLFWFGFLRSQTASSAFGLAFIALTCAFLGDFPRINVFAFAIGGIIFAIVCLRNWRWNWNCFSYLMLCVIFGVLSEWRLAAQIIFDPQPTNRIEFKDHTNSALDSWADLLPLLRSVLSEARTIFFNGVEWHTVIPSALVLVFVLEFFYVARGNFLKSQLYLFSRFRIMLPLVLLIIPAIIQTRFGIPRFMPVQYFRFSVLLPFAAATIALYVIVTGKLAINHTWLLCILVISGCVEYFRTTQWLSLDDFIGRKSLAAHKAYFQSHFDIDKDKVASIGLHPAISVYSGFRAADFYLPYYPLSKKYQFAQMIQDELARSTRLINYFYDWGSRAYFFSADLDFFKDYYNDPSARYQQTISPLYDYRLMHERGIRMILSRVRLQHPCLQFAAQSTAPASYEIVSYVITCE
jgi:hypothetical protein